MPNPAIADRRESIRIDFGGDQPIQIDLSSDDNFYIGFTNTIHNLSSGGLFIVTANPPPVSTEITVRFRIPNFDRDIVARCVVKWHRKSRPDCKDMIPGMGVQFLTLDKDAERAINEFISRYRKAIFYPD